MVVNDNSKSYVIAVSGGIDSVVLLHMAYTHNQLFIQAIDHDLNNDYQIIVAHFDHGIRKNSRRDREFVQALARHYKLIFEYAEGNLGSAASEAVARKARYDFLQRVKTKHQAQAIMTAHHQDDVLETAIINVLRGTKYKGLSSLKSTKTIIRPLLEIPKTELITFAQRHNLKWREDPSNIDTSHLRNYVRRELMPVLDKRDPSWRDSFLIIIHQAKSLHEQIHSHLSLVMSDHVHKVDKSKRIDRHWFTMLPNQIALEVFAKILSQLIPPLTVDKILMRKAVMFCKTAQSGKKLSLNKFTSLEMIGSKIHVRTLGVESR